MGMKSMKAVYETPKVSFEAFMANNAVSACAIAPNSYDCVMHGNFADDGHSSFDGDCSEPSNVVANILGLSGCNNNAGFADLVRDDQGYEDDNDITTDNVIGLGGTLSTDPHVLKSTKEPSPQQGQSLLGWLYITRTGDGYNTEGWDRGWLWGDVGYRLHYIGQRSWSAWLAPLFGTKATSGA